MKPKQELAAVPLFFHIGMILYYADKLRNSYSLGIIGPKLFLYPLIFLLGFWVWQTGLVKILIILEGQRVNLQSKVSTLVHLVAAFLAAALGYSPSFRHQAG